MLATAGVEAGLAMRASIVGSHVVRYAQFIATDPAEDGLLVKIIPRPNLVLVVGFFFMAGKARVIFVTAFELDCDDIQLRVPMHAAGLIVHRLAKDIDPPDLGYFQGFEDFILSQASCCGKSKKAQNEQ